MKRDTLGLLRLLTFFIERLKRYVLRCFSPRAFSAWGFGVVFFFPSFCGSGCLCVTVVFLLRHIWKIASVWVFHASLLWVFAAISTCSPSCDAVECSLPPSPRSLTNQGLWLLELPSSLAFLALLSLSEPFWKVLAWSLTLVIWQFMGHSSNSLKSLHGVSVFKLLLTYTNPLCFQKSHTCAAASSCLVVWTSLGFSFVDLNCHRRLVFKACPL